jgi:aspartyl-tRNA(Asn)/glutamyl-tRNA(Gln) amidotransferase subunit A
MADLRLAWLPATELAAMIRKRKVSPVDVVDAALDRIEKLNPRLNAFVTVTDTAARREAKAAERALGKRSARLGPLHGVPFSVKDLVNTRGVRTTFGTPFYRDNVPAEDAPMVERMKDRRRHHARQDQHADVRLDRRHAQPRVRDHAQPVEP